MGDRREGVTVRRVIVVKEDDPFYLTPYVPVLGGTEDGHNPSTCVGKTTMDL